MAGEKLNLRVITPEKEKVNRQVDMVILRAINGEVGFLSGHEPFSCVLDDFGLARIIGGGKEYRIAVFGGIAEVKDNMLTVLANEAVLPREITRERAEAEISAAEQAKLDSIDDLEIQENDVKLRRALVVFEMSSYTIINAPDWDDDTD
jgi:F-type H+-transporting ATPase subunit epsilon